MKRYQLSKTTSTMRPSVAQNRVSLKRGIFRGKSSTTFLRAFTLQAIVSFLSYVDEVSHRWIEPSVLGVSAKQPPLSEVHKVGREMFSSHTSCRHLVSHGRNVRRTTCMALSRSANVTVLIPRNFTRPGKAYPGLCGVFKVSQT